MAFTVWKQLFESTFWTPMSNEVADALEADFYWIQSVDRTTYGQDANQIVIEATIDFESVYLNNPQEWRSDTWDLYQSWSRNIWTSFVEGFESTDSDNLADWPRWTPSLVLQGNAGRLRVECSGDLIYRVSQRAATQTEFLTECSFTP